MADDAAKRSKVTLVFAGVREGEKRKLWQCFYKVCDDNSVEKESRAYTKLKGLGRPGGMYEMDCDAEKESTIYPGTMRYVGFLDDDALVTQWQAQHDAAQAADRARRRQARETGQNLIHEHLEPIRKAYAKCTGLERSALIAQVVAYVTGRTAPHD